MHNLPKVKILEKKEIQLHSFVLILSITYCIIKIRNLYLMCNDISTMYIHLGEQYI